MGKPASKMVLRCVVYTSAMLGLQALAAFMVLQSRVAAEEDAQNLRGSAGQKKATTTRVVVEACQLYGGTNPGDPSV